jgi:hypothetical protein
VQSATGGAAGPTTAPRLAGQFAAGRGELPLAPARWPRHSFRDWTLATHPSLTVRALAAGDGTPRGWLAGHAFDGAQPAGTTVALPVEAGPAAAEDALYRLGGRWVALADLGDGPSFHLDATGSMAAVYGLEAELVASTPWLVLGDRYHADLDRTLMAQVEAGAPGWGPTYYGGTTAHRAVRRLLPNHRLDLQAWSPRRHWPPRPVETDADPLPTAQAIAAAIEGSVAAATRIGGIHLSVTAGYDSRLVLACSRAHLTQARLYTTARSRHEVDASVARAMRRRLRLDVAILPVVSAGAAEVEAWRTETGHCVGGAIAGIHPSLARLDPRRLTLPGLCGEIGRCTSHADGDGDRVPSARELLERWGIPPLAAFLAGLEGWLAELEGQPAAAVRDLFHVEQQLGCWVGPQQYGTVAWSDVVLPMSQRAVIEAMLRLPVDYRRRQRLVLDVCAARWPELLQFPFNDLAGREALERSLRLQARRARRLAAGKARGAARRLRARMGR